MRGSVCGETRQKIAIVPTHLVCRIALGLALAVGLKGGEVGVGIVVGVGEERVGYGFKIEKKMGFLKKASLFLSPQSYSHFSFLSSPIHFNLMRVTQATFSYSTVIQMFFLSKFQ